MKFSEQLKAGVILDNPIFMQTIGLCPALATTTSLSNAIGMGVAATVVLMAAPTWLSPRCASLFRIRSVLRALSPLSQPLLP